MREFSFTVSSQELSLGTFFLIRLSSNVHKSGFRLSNIFGGEFGIFDADAVRVSIKTIVFFKNSTALIEPASLEGDASGERFVQVILVMSFKTLIVASNKFLETKDNLSDVLSFCAGLVGFGFGLRANKGKNAFLRIVLARSLGHPSHA